MSLFVNRLFSNEITELESLFRSRLIQKSAESEKEFNKILNSLRNLLVKTFDSQSQKAIREVIDYLLSLNRETFNKTDAKNINKLLVNKLGLELSKLTSKSIKELTRDLFKFGAAEISGSILFDLSFNLKDDEAIEVLGKHNNFWVGNYYLEHVQSTIKEILNGYFGGDKTITNVAIDFEKKFANYTDKGLEYFEGLAEHTSNRIRALGQITGMQKAEVEFYKIVSIIDERTSEVCRFMDGKIFPLSRAIEYRDHLLSLKSPEDIKKFSPWISPRQLKEIQEQKIVDPDLPVGLTIPPFHWKCRTTIRVYSKPKLEVK